MHMGLKEWLIPQDKIFFELLEKHSLATLEGANKLAEILRHTNGLEEKIKQLKDIEHKGDALVKEIHTELNKTFITPIDKEDIAVLASRLDDILDIVYASGKRVFLYEIKPNKAMLEMADIIVECAKGLNDVLPHVRNLDNIEMIESFRIEVNKLENVADEILNKSLADLFKGTDPIMIMKFKEIIEFLELATDKCEDAANVIGDILLKHR